MATIHDLDVKFDQYIAGRDAREQAELAAKDATIADLTAQLANVPAQAEIDALDAKEQAAIDALGAAPAVVDGTGPV